MARELMNAMQGVETFSQPSPVNDSNLQEWLEEFDKRNAAGGAGAGMGLTPQQSGSIDNSKSSAVNIAAVNVYTTADKADGIARDIGNSLNYLFVSQANAGMVT